MPKQTYFIKGMHCASCEVLIEKELLEMPGVVFADASLAKGLVNIEYNGKKPGIGELNAKFEKLGYSFSEKAVLQERPKKEIWSSFAFALAAIGIFLIMTKLGFASFVSVNAKSSLPIFFIFGLIAGVSSCAALIGGLVLSLSKQWSGDSMGSSGLSQKIKPHLLFNLGRLLSFSLLGALLGLLGEKFRISPSITSVLVVFVSAVMLILALQMLGVKWFNRFRIALPKAISGRLVKEGRSPKSAPFVIGFLTFLLPCGFTVVAEGAAVLSGSPLKGLIIMLLFTLGTMLPLLAIGFSSAKFLSKEHLSEKFLKAAGVLIIFFVAYNINFQFGVARYLSDVWQKENLINNYQSQIQPPAKDVQLIKTVYTSLADIQPSSFEVKKGQPVRFEVEVRDNGYGCMSTIMVPGLWNRPLALKKGKILVMEFTPQRVGDYEITCAMGVPRGILIVVN